MVEQPLCHMSKNVCVFFKKINSNLGLGIKISYGVYIHDLLILHFFLLFIDIFYLKYYFIQVNNISILLCLCGGDARADHKPAGRPGR